MATGAEAQSAGGLLKGHISKLYDALTAYSTAVGKKDVRIDRTRSAVTAALKDWKAIHLRLVRQLVDEDPHGTSEEVYRVRTATALCLAAEGLKDSDCEVFRTDSAIEADWLYVKALIDYGNSLTFGTTKKTSRYQTVIKGSKEPPLVTR